MKFLTHSHRKSKSGLKGSYTIIIPNYNGENVLKKLFAKTVKHIPQSSILFVDDGSTDNSVLYIKKSFPKIRIIEKERHEGFSKTIQTGINHVKTDICILLNNDVVPDSNFIKPLLQNFSDKKVFAVGCYERSVIKGITYFQGRGLAYWKYGMYKNSFDATNKKQTAWVSGGSGAFRISLWKTLGGLDTNFDPFYWEDVDICYRARKSGYTILFEPKSKVTHYHDHGAITNEYSSSYIHSIIIRNTFLFTWKNLSSKRIAMIHLLSIPMRLSKALFQGNISYILGFSKALQKLPGMLSQRQKLKNMWTLEDDKLNIYL